jgi:hypothetical protein
MSCFKNSGLPVLVVEEETRNKYLACVVSAQLVSKFLGFVQFYSYKPTASGNKLSEQSVIAQVSLRENVTIHLFPNPLLMNIFLVESCYQHPRIFRKCGKEQQAHSDHSVAVFVYRPTGSGLT